MCINKVESFEYGGQLYPTELEAVEAAVRVIGIGLMKDHHANLGAGLIENRAQLLDLLTRYERIKARREKEGKGSSKKGVPPSSTKIDAAYRSAMGSARVRAETYIHDQGFGNVESFLERAPSFRKRRLAAILGLSPNLVEDEG